MPSFTQEVDLGVSAPRLWKAMKDSSVLFPKFAPHLFASVEVEGQGTDEHVGAVRVIKFGSVAPAGSYVKEKLVALDHSTFSVTTEETEGGHLVRGFTKWAPTIKFTPVDDKSSKLTATVEYEGENEGAIAQAKEGFVKLFKGLAGYIESSGAYA